MNSKKLKILMIGTTDNQGGAARVSWDLGQELIRKGHDVKFLVSRKYSNESYVEGLDSNKYHNFSIFLRYLRSFILSDDICYGHKSKILNHPWYKSADIVHLHNMHGSYIQLDILKTISKEKKVIWTLHDMWSILGDSTFTSNRVDWVEGKSNRSSMLEYPPMIPSSSFKLWKRKKKIYEESKFTLVVPSQWLKDCIVDQSILSRKKCYVVPNGVDSDFFSPFPRAVSGNISQNYHLIFVAGNIKDKRKGWIKLKQSVEGIPNLHITVLGASRSYRDNRITYVKKQKSPDAVRNYLRKADGLLFASSHENSPLTVIEAMCCSLPVIGYFGGGSSELVHHQPDCLISQSQDPVELRKCIMTTIRTPKTILQEIGKTNRKHAILNYSLAKMTSTYEKVYRSL